MNPLIFPFLLLIFLAKPLISAKMCYTCSTAVYTECATLEDTTRILMCQPTVKDQEILCSKFSYLYKKREIVYRGCHPLNHTCDDIEKDLLKENKVLRNCSLCDTDLCTNRVATAHIHSKLVIPLILLIAFLF